MFQLYRQKILELIFSRRPELISHAVRLILSPHCEMRDRYFVLKSMIGAANYIATGKGLVRRFHIPSHFTILE